MTEQSKTTELPKKMYWRDKDVEELTRDELIAALRHCYQMYRSATENQQSTLRMWELCRRAA